MHWLSQGQNGTTSLDELQLDIVGFLAILGEGSVLANAQVSTLSKWIFLPRLIPAPQAMMRPTRPNRLEPFPGYVTGIVSGNHRDSINHIGNIVCDANNLDPFSVRVVKIVRDTDKSPLKAKTIAPLTVVLFIGFALSALLLALSIWQEDGMSILATVLLSLLTSLIGYGNKWTLKLPQRKNTTTRVPRGDVVIRYPKGSFLIVQCDENVARELYFAPESIDYLLTHGPAYRILSLVGTTMLMGGVICLANAQIQVQIAWAGSYMLLGAAYWIVAALPGKMHWDTSCYRVENQCLSDSKMDEKGYPSKNATFTQALWRTIVVTKNIEWITRSVACPDTPAWRQWLREAKACSSDVMFSECEARPGVRTWEVPDWDPQAALTELLDEEAKKDDRREGFEEV
ncbi:hypothetical protein PtrSN002B_002027 [Pyrenophora tritici-repentis]|uniref:Uncharacterized protein n=2 Tax=Pyrenophora tritici-repentis TaxID=45151 RepID=A0A2W1GY01_9PLEO|nr:uncharacterized protein PTRG_05917 [Pyrenophora tritici-repentis Pt-1C-BFP]KAA8619036.1 hypothetical protein PtrV1_08465 [Pyrenophora tritici-repentis]EDU48837.1 conserved hypothetical protein [Pyrenophora tritici-repentis Pt-1C-BFP]KAF7449500.1 hypothetical protein A1F99_065490 [Pyrenophora tritici-repentis]KAF7570386.1 hypothetical protein PtrM4_103880 [Pyrenophora tritici-repentis]KAG9383560.1 hypothetical protein A1F94_005471 [Pyrenophora tritici-repentis]